MLEVNAVETASKVGMPMNLSIFKTDSFVILSSKSTLISRCEHVYCDIRRFHSVVLIFINKLDVIL